jgi:hypothetical protein
MGGFMDTKPIRALALIGMGTALLSFSAYNARAQSMSDAKLVIEKFKELLPEKQQIAVEALKTYQIVITGSDGTTIGLSAPEAPLVVKTAELCNLKVIGGLKDGSITTPDAAAKTKVDCLQKDLASSGIKAILTGPTIQAQRPPTMSSPSPEPAVHSAASPLAQPRPQQVVKSITSYTISQWMSQCQQSGGEAHYDSTFHQYECWPRQIRYAQYPYPCPYGCVVTFVPTVVVGFRFGPYHYHH